jgi:hypothetical protein
VCVIAYRRVFWAFVLAGWKMDNIDIISLRFAYEKMRDQPLSDSHFIGKMYGDC